ncbi:unnamed protein product, partial [Rhizoctonia solani]
MKQKEEADVVSSGSSDSTLRPEEPGKTGAPREVCIEEPKPRASKLPTRILIVGPSGFGKTKTINDFCHSTDSSIINDTYQPTKHVSVQRLHFEGKHLDLIDTPGFDNVQMSDVDAFSEVADYLLNPTQEDDYRRVVNEMKSRGSAFGAAFSAGATIASAPNQAGFIATLRSYFSQAPIVLPVQLDESFRAYSAFVDRIETELGYYEYKSAQSLLDGLEQKLRGEYERQPVGQPETEAQLRQELEKTRLDYSSLRSQLQLHENTEQGEVVQALCDLNRMIEDLGRSISSYLCDEYVDITFGKDLADVTALDALDLPALKTLAGHVQGRSSFVQASSDHGMQIECFFDFMIRNKICVYLNREIFSPFHPGVSPSLNQVLRATLENLQRQVPQAIAGKWRSDTFKHISEPEHRRLTSDQHISLLLNKLIDSEM